jgi:protein O-GlcNAc transferase
MTSGVEQLKADVVALMRAGDLGRAEARLRDYLDSGNVSFDGSFLLATVLASQGKPQEALIQVDHALTQNSGDPRALVVRGDVLAQLGREDDALQSYGAARSRGAAQRIVDPRCAAVFFSRGRSQMRLGRWEAAEAALTQALALDPQLADAHALRGECLLARQHLLHADQALRQALALREEAHWWNLLANNLLNQARVEEALTAYDKAVALNPPDAALIHSNRLVALHYSSEANAEALFAEHLRWRALHLPARVEKSAPSPRKPGPLRVGYVSPRFFISAAGALIEPVLTHHDRSQVEVFCYNTSTVEDALTQRLRAAVPHWRSIAQLSDAEAAALIRADDIDVLVDLAGHAPGGRLGLFALRPARVAITWLDYFDTTGLDAIDYIVTDPLHTPDGVAQRFSESVARMPEIRFCFQPPADAPEPAPAPCTQGRGVTFGVFSRLAKIDDRMLERWSRVLSRIPGSRLIVKSMSLQSADMQSAQRERFARRGIAPSSLELRAPSPHREMLAQYADVDIVLDTHPYNGGLTTLEALWMGVPVVTWWGDSMISRQSASILSHIGHAELIAATAADYEDLAVSLAQAPERIASLRKALRPALSRSTLCSPERFTRQFEQLLRELAVQ